MDSTRADANGASRLKRQAYLFALILRRIGPKRGAKKARIATAHKQLKIAFLIIRDGLRYKDLGPNHLDLRNKERTRKYLVGRLEGLGLRVTAEPEDP